MLQAPSASLLIVITIVNIILFLLLLLLLLLQGTQTLFICIKRGYAVRVLCNGIIVVHRSL